jgi:proline iminopeptidase
MATTIDAPPSRIWPWLVQMGCDRAGWYSWDKLDNGGRASAEEIHPEWQQIAIGDRLLATPSGGARFEVVALEPERFLALRAPVDLGSVGRSFDTALPRPRFFSDSTWCFLLTDLPGGRTRLVVSGYACSAPRPLTKLADLLVWELAHWIMQTRQFTNLKRRTQRYAADGHGKPATSGPIVELSARAAA